ERGGQPADPALHHRAVLREELGEPAGRLLLLEAQLGIGVDLVADLFQFVRGAIDRLRDPRLDLIERGHGYFVRVNSSLAALTLAGPAWRSRVVMPMGLPPPTHPGP